MKSFFHIVISFDALWSSYMSINRLGLLDIVNIELK